MTSLYFVLPTQELSSFFLVIWGSIWLVFKFLSLQYLFFQFTIWHLMFSEVCLIFPTVLAGVGGLSYEGGKCNILTLGSFARIKIKLIYFQPLFLPPQRSFLRLKIQRFPLLSLLSVLVPFLFLLSARLTFFEYLLTVLNIPSHFPLIFLKSIFFSSVFLESFSSMLSTSLIWFSACGFCPSLVPGGIFFLCWHLFCGFLTFFLM